MGEKKGGGESGGSGEREGSVRSENNNPHNSFTFVDLFCGIGGFHLALADMGGKCVFASDSDAKCRETYEANYRMKVAGDITKISVDDIPDHHLLCGGFPCQSFSKAGFQKGFDDDRGNLFFSICKIVEAKKPAYLLLENVRNLATHDAGNTWKVIRESLDALGYVTYDKPVILNVLHFNIPQNRERVIIMCKRKDLGDMPPLPPIPTNPKRLLTASVADFIRDSESTEHEMGRITGKLATVELVWDAFVRLMVDSGTRIPRFPIWTEWWDNGAVDQMDGAGKAFYAKYTGWICKNRAFYAEHREVLEPWLMWARKQPLWKGAVRKFEWQAGDERPDDSMETVMWTTRGSGIRVKRPDYIPTLVAMSMIPVYGPQHRKLIPKELLRLQSFPTDFKYVEKNIYKQLGNAVNVTMIRRCAGFLMRGEGMFG
jgi:DNA (cytosine-5)-methyltransferase 1